MKTLIVTSLAAIALAACMNSNAASNPDKTEPLQTSQIVSIDDFKSVTGTMISSLLPEDGQAHYPIWIIQREPARAFLCKFQLINPVAAQSSMQSNIRARLNIIHAKK